MIHLLNEKKGVNTVYVLFGLYQLVKHMCDQHYNTLDGNITIKSHAGIHKGFTTDFIVIRMIQ